MFVNSSIEDLDTLDVPDDSKYHIKNGKGAGKERDVAKKLLDKNYSEIISRINYHIKGNIVLMIANSGGGTGSGMTPKIMYQLLEQNKKDMETDKTVEKLIICPITVLPYGYEGFQSKMNTCNYFAEIQSINDLGTSFVINNNKSNDILYLNKMFFELFFDYIKIPDFKNTIGNIDISEIENTLKSTGMTVISSLEYTDIFNVSDIFVDIKEHDIFSLEDSRKIKHIAISFPITATEPDFNSIINNLKKEFGNAISEYKGYNDTNRVITVLSGLSFPNSFLDSCQEEVMAQQEEIKNNIKKERKAQYLSFDFEDKQEETASGFNGFFS